MALEVKSIPQERREKMEIEKMERKRRIIITFCIPIAVDTCMYSTHCVYMGYRPANGWLCESVEITRRGQTAEREKESFCGGGEERKRWESDTHESRNG